ncbi:unnamed protein product [Mytilus edulis]|uniref:Uncharacterized protein n=1 Tax=Mytilus edulis TaxID=6550 RepID=A0A8S3RY39_MYTED|nr:unnamed protein product [Mytilus edulis]
MSSKREGKTCIHKGLNRKHSCNVQSVMRPPKEEAKHAYTKALTKAFRKHSCNVQSATPLHKGINMDGKTCIHKGLNRKHSCNVQSVNAPSMEREAKHAYTKALTENIPAMPNQRCALHGKGGKTCIHKGLNKNIPAKSNLLTPSMKGRQNMIYTKDLNRKHSCKIQSADAPRWKGRNT